jgi:hypothetical protein
MADGSEEVHGGQPGGGSVHLKGFWLAFCDTCTISDLRRETGATEDGCQVQTMGQPRLTECWAARRNSET